MRMRQLCEGMDVVDVVYGDGVNSGPGWWGRCAECGQFVAVVTDGESEWPNVHWRRDEDFAEQEPRIPSLRT